MWQISSDPVYQIIGTATADMMAIVPTIKKIFKDPDSESSSAFFSGSVAALIGMLGIGHWDLVLILYPLYLYSINLITAIIIVSAKKVKKSIKLKENI